MKQKHLLLTLLSLLLAVPFHAMADDAVVATCADVIAGEDGTVFRVTGKCTDISNTKYGNWWLEDETGRIYIYGTNDKEGNKGANPMESWGIEVGDIVTVEGPKNTYGGTIELVDVTVISVQKSKLKVTNVTPEDATLTPEGGEVVVTLLNEVGGGAQAMVEIPEEAKSWLSIAVEVATETLAENEEIVTLIAAANDGGERQATVTFKATDSADGTEYIATVTITQASSIIDATVAEFNAAEVNGQLYRLTGIISSVANASYGNFYLRDYSGETYIYGYGSRGEFEDAGLKAGDIVTMVGKRDVYKETIEMKNGTCESFEHVTEISIPDFYNKENDKYTYYMVTGTISSIANATYGNLYLTDGEVELYVYGCYPGWGATGDARKGWLAEANIEVGDQLTMIGYKDEYKGTVELCGGIYFSHTKGTGISATKADAQGQTIYNLAGQRLQAPQKGINIVGGKKLVVK